MKITYSEQARAVIKGDRYVLGWYEEFSLWLTKEQARILRGL